MSENKKVHRRLTVISPAIKGDDVKALQRNINERYKHFKVDRRVAVDGEFGRQTLNAAWQIAKAMGAGHNNLKAFKKGAVTKNAQKLIRGRKKTKAENVRTKARTNYRKRLRKTYNKSGGELAIKKAQKWVGSTENPYGSNWGHPVEDFIKFTGYTYPVYWCGCWAAWVVVKLGGAKIPSRIRLGYAPYITDDARNNRNGLTAVAFENARAGDIVTFWGGQHIGVVEKYENGVLYTIEGNTSPEGGSGSQSNGGGVYKRKRYKSDVDCIARPAY
jgi:hypothetical protein